MADRPHETPTIADSLTEAQVAQVIATARDAIYAAEVRLERAGRRQECSELYTLRLRCSEMMARIR